MKFAEGAPVFAVEIRSENDRGPAAEGRLATKRADYFAAGTLVVWDVDLEAEGADVVLDFNYAYNPFCAYSPHWVCPVPPVENTLTVAIRAGEQTFG